MNLSNTVVRILVSVIAIPLIILSTYLGGLFFFTFVSAIGIISFYEFSKMMQNKKVSVNLVFGVILVLMIIITSYNKNLKFEPVIIFSMIFLSIFELFRNKGSAILNLGATILGLFYIGIFAGTILNIREFFTGDYLSGGLLLISIFAAIWICDSAAFFVGSAIGKHKLFPRVSPKKSWEGAIAGFVFAILTMIASKFLVLEFLTFSDVIIIGLIVGSIGQIGDLVESLFKRDAGVKDSSAIIPGHGGIFDRFDSLLLTSPVVYLYLYYFVR